MDERTQLRLDRINGKGMAVATRLADLLAGKEVDMSELGAFWSNQGRRKKEARLRAFLDQINRARKRLVSGGGYGTCGACGEGFDNATLDEMPWIERCPGCEGKDAPLTS